ncbi:Immunoglobulin iota chain [Myotis brandtii]|nr:Immunoglobulin iota chain [Myotis brandtii]
MTRPGPGACSQGRDKRPGQCSPSSASWERAALTMAWTPVLLVLLAHCTGSLSQPVLTQPPSLSASLGATARLTCTLRSDVSVVGKAIHWFQQKPGSPPRFLLYYYTGTNLGPGVPSRFSGSKDASANAGLLTISGLQPEDEANYYCMISHSSASHSVTHRWGSGTKTIGQVLYKLLQR